MGMYDTLTVKSKLPLTKELKSLNIDWKEEYLYQTKDLGESLGHFEITKLGNLKQLVIDGEWVDDPNGKWINKKFIEKKREYKKINHHGVVIFYTNFNDVNDHDWWVEFKAVFTKGKLENIQLEKVEKTQSSVRHEYEKNWQENWKRELKKPSYKIKSFLRKYLFWHYTWRTVISILQKTIGFIQRNII